MEHEAYPYDWAYKKLGFFQSAIRVASSEDERQSFPWTKAFADDFDGRFNSYLQTIRPGIKRKRDFAGRDLNGPQRRRRPVVGRGRCRLGLRVPPPPHRSYIRILAA
jgi:hypothetical protein